MKARWGWLVTGRRMRARFWTKGEALVFFDAHKDCCSPTLRRVKVIG